MTEKLTIKRLGPLKDLTIEPKPLTVIIGEQASGKSLVAQVLYFFRGLKGLVAKNYTPGITTSINWSSELIRQLLDDLRGVPFKSYSDRSTALEWERNGTNYRIDTHSEKGLIPNTALHSQIESWIKNWAKDKKSFEEDMKSEWIGNQLFIPTDRSLFTRLWSKAQSVLFAPYQPQPLRHFADLLSIAYPLYQNLYPAHSEQFHFILNCQRNALGGEAYVPEQGPEEWKWKIKGKKKSPLIPIEAASSGQMEGWPFFVIAGTFGANPTKKDFYFEEPETHLHPRAQVEIMRAIGYLVNGGHTFVITTHSPFLLYVINNMIQRHISYKGNFPEKEDIALSPDDVVAYRLGDHPEVISGDKATGLLNLEELEKVADELGGEFDRLLDKMDEAR